MKPEKLKKLVEEGKITNDNSLLAFEVSDAIESHLEGIQGKLEDVVQAVKDIPQPESVVMPEIPEFPTSISVDNFPEQKEVKFPAVQKVEVINFPKEKENTDLDIYSKLDEISNKIVPTDIQPIVDALNKEEEKDEPTPFKFNKDGRLEVAVDKVSQFSGGGGIYGPIGIQSALGQHINPATEETLQANSGKYSTIMVEDSVDTNLIYIGDVTPGSIASTSSAIWRISRMDTTTLLTVTYAGGSKEFNQIWDSRESLIYS